ncbi:alpha/beta-hydrolase family protein [Micromonospora sp. NBC_00898]|uniref:alpha/beta hydrolase n=1 Tax=Micromonospora sp. NBC_00898 TaxID=2975981 RepID=UPI003864683A|nr:alpha/beta-hydrolase family protein [Micromonospora sp. NBC_00898]
MSTPPGSAVRAARRRPVRRWFASYGRSLAGASFAVVWLCLSLTPSLLPRTWVQQGLIGGLSASLGYAVGFAFGALVIRLIPRRHRPGVRRVGWRVFAGLSVPLVAVSLYRGSVWQRDIHRLMGQQPPSRYAYVAVLVLSVAVFVVLTGSVRMLWALAAVLSRLLRRWVPRRGAQVIALTAVLLASIGTLNEVVYDGGTRIVTAMARTMDAGTSRGALPPMSAARSGSPTSLVSWASLGREGRSFVSGGPGPAELVRFSGVPAKDPVRVYVGRASSPTLDGEALLAVRELERTGAFTRKTLCVITTTGTGWIDPQAVAALEYMDNGDSALVGIQYSYLPSWSSFVLEQGRPAEAGKALFDRVYARWSTLPAGHRPRLLVFGESLGALGAEGAFSGLDDIVNHTDGALFAGPTHADPIWQDLTAHRDAGSPEAEPTYEGGRVVWFAAQPADLTRSPGRPDPRVVYLQHSSDPVVWWSPKLLVHQPDWLKERRGVDVLPDMHWYPLVTLLQVTADLDAAYAAPPAHGHRYSDMIVAGWAAIAAPAGWTAARTRDLTAVIDPSN